MVIIFFLFFWIFTCPVFGEGSIKINNYSATSPEYVELINNSSTEFNLSGWSIKDDNSSSTDDIFFTSKDIIPANSTKKFNNGKDSGWLNDSGDIIYLYDDSNNLVDKLAYPSSTSTPTSIPTLIPTSSPTNIPTPTITSAPTITPTADSTIINPTSGIIFTEFMPYSSLEWIEIYNNNDKPVELKGWKIQDNSSKTKTIPDLKISSKSYKIFEFSSFLNNDTDKIILLNHDNQSVGQYEYPNGKLTLERSWSYINSSWCQAEITQNSPNLSSCYSAPTTIPTSIITNSPAPTILTTPTTSLSNKDLYQLDESATASAVFTPIEEEISQQPTPTISSNSITSNLVLGQTTTAKKNYLPLTFIVSGGLLLMSPILIDKIKKK